MQTDWQEISYIDGHVGWQFIRRWTHTKMTELLDIFLDKWFADRVTGKCLDCWNVWMTKYIRLNDRKYVQMCWKEMLCFKVSLILKFETKLNVNISLCVLVNVIKGVSLKKMENFPNQKSSVELKPTNNCLHPIEVSTVCPFGILFKLI